MKKTLSLLIVLAMLIGMVPAVFAAEKTPVQITSVDELTTGEYYIVCSNGVGLGAVDGTWITSADESVWTVTVTDNGVTLQDANGTFIAPAGGNKNGLKTSEYEWAVSCTDGMFTFAGQGSDTVYLAYNADSQYQKFRGYKTTTCANTETYPSTFALYKLTEAEEEEPIVVENPIVVGDNEIELPMGSTEPSVYNFVATETGTLYIVATEFYYMASWTEGQYEDNSQYMEDWTNNTIFTVNGEALSGGFYGSVEVVAGQVYTFSWSLQDHCTWGFKASINLSYSDENMPVPGIDMGLRPVDLPCNTVEIPAGETVTYMVTYYEFEGYMLTVTGENVYVTYQQFSYATWEFETVTLEPVDGVIELDVGANYIQEFQIGNNGTEAATFALDYYAPEGGLKNPIRVETLDEIQLTIPAQTQGYTYFIWTAPEVGAVWVCPPEGMYINFENQTTGDYGDYDDSYENYFIYVMPGDELLIVIDGWFEVDTFYQFEYEFVPGYRPGSEQNPIEVDLLEGLNVSGYDKNEHYTWTPAESMVIELYFTLANSYSTNVPTVTINGEAVEFGVIAYDGTVNSVGAQLTVNAGETVNICVSHEISVYGNLQATVIETIEPENPTIKIHVIAPESWANVYAYVWNPESMGSWPGTLLVDGVIEVAPEFDGLIINNGSGIQTADIKDIDPTAKEVWVVVSEDCSYALFYSEEDVVLPEPVATIKINIVAEHWTNVYAYTFNPANCGNWPGTLVENGSIEVPASFEGLVLNNGAGQQTADIKDIDLTQAEVWITVAADNSYTLSYVDPNPELPEVENPIVVGDNEIELPMGSTEPSVYNFVATETGTLYIVATEFYYMASWTEGQYEDNSMYMEDWINNTIFTVNGEALSGGFYGSVEVVAGQVYTFSWSLQDHCEWGFKASINLSYSDENMPVPGIDMMLMPSDLPMNTVEIPAGGEQLYKFSYEFNGYIITITGENAYITFQTFNYDIWDYETVRIDAVDGVVEYDMSVYGMSEISIGNAGTEAVTFALDYYAPVGGEKNPIIVENLEDIFVSGDTELYTGVYFQWTSDKQGTIIVDTSVLGNMSFYNVTKDEYGEFESDWITYKVYVEPGDVLNIVISLSTEADYNFTYDFVEGYRLGSELNPYPVDLMEGVYIDLYDETIYYTWTPAADMTVTLDFTCEYTWNEKVPTVWINGEAYTLGEELTVTAGEALVLEVSTNEGSVYGTLKATEVTGEDPVDPPVDPDPGFEMPENGEVLVEETVNVPNSWLGIAKTFEMAEDGTLYVVIGEHPEECSVEYAFYVSGNAKHYYHTHNDGNVQTIEVLAGDTVKLELCLLSDNGNGGYTGGDVSYRLVFVPAEGGEEECEHEYVDGVCIHCGEEDPNYVPELGEGVLFDDTVTTTEETAFWGEVFTLTAPADGYITVSFVYTDIYPEYQVNIADGWGEWLNVANGDPDTMTYEVHAGDTIQISVATQNADMDYVAGSVEMLVTFVAGEIGGDVEIDTVLELGENIINIAAGETLSYQYTFVPETDGMLDLSLLTLKYTYGGMTEDVTEFLADYLAEGVIAIQVNGYDYTEPVAVTAGEEVIITITQSRMYSNYGYAWEATLNVAVTEAVEVLAGDANGDGEINYMDAIMVLQYAVEEEAEGIDMSAADMNGDGEINYLDAIAILQYAVESEE